MAEVNIEDIDVLLVDDDEAIRDSLGEYIESCGWNVRVADSPTLALEIVAEGYGDVVISDIKMPEMDGVTLLGKLKEIKPELEVLMITGHSNEALAIDALKAGAFDYFRKPLNAEEIITSLYRTGKYQQLREENRNLKELVSRYVKLNSRHNFFSDAPGSQNLLKQFQKVGEVPYATVLLTGESGVGKEVAARMVHNLSAGGEGAPFVAVNCGGLPENLLESELFGHEKGAFTGADKTKPGVFEMAKGGTVFLDEVSEMSMAAQSRFLRVLEERTFRRVGGQKEYSFDDVRVVTATNRSLQEQVEKGEFRHDLLYRINVASIHIPALRERSSDIVPLAQYFLEAINDRLNKNLILTRSAERSLMKYEFPGNIRELRNMLERASIFASTNKLTPFDLGLKADLSEDPEEEEEKGGGLQMPENLCLRDHEILLIRQAIQQHPNNHSAAARSLGITPQALYRKQEKYGIESP